MFRQYLKTRVADEIGVVPKCSFYQPSLFDEFLIDEGTRCSDITFVFSQQRLDKVISKENFDQYFNALFKDSSPNPYAGMSDDEIMDLVKDRRILLLMTFTIIPEIFSVMRPNWSITKSRLMSVKCNKKSLKVS